MKDNGIIDFTVKGWLDRNDTQFWGKTHSGWFKLFGRPDREVLVEAEFCSSENPFDEKSICVFHPKDKKGEILIYVSIYLPRERFHQIYQTLCRFQSCLEKIEVSIGYKKIPNSDEECSVEELIFITCSGDYFQESGKDEFRKRSSWFPGR